MRYLRNCIGAIAILIVAASLALYLTLRASLPLLDGEVVLMGLSADASIERDASGVATIRASSRRDLAFATGYTHAQERFFQMDLMRRAAAGELAELFGADLVTTDQQLRVHGFRQVAQQVIERSSHEDRAVLESYTNGVNAALERLKTRPWEYFPLRVTPRPWQIDDSILVAFSLYLDLNDSNGSKELARAQLREALPAELFSFLHPLGTEWDAPITGGTWRASPIPGADIFDLRSHNVPTPLEEGTQSRAKTSCLPRSALRCVVPGLSRQTPAPSLLWSQQAPTDFLPGSNSWAVAGTHTANGAALLANDMHLTLRLPQIWYRARLIVESDVTQRRDLIGITLPGLPMLLAGSNGRVAWGYTNSYGDWTDLVLVETDPEDKQRYLTAQGSEAFELRNETILVRGGPSVEVSVRTTRWGPVIHQDTRGRAYALAWTAHAAEATNLRMMDFESARDVQQILDTANRAGGPVQNLMAADADGKIGWSLMGLVPIRANYDSTLPSSRREEGNGWVGWRAPEEYPRVIEPANGRLWTANARTIDAQSWLAFMGDGGYDLGARAAQIRDSLFGLSSATADDMVRVQIDDRALFLVRWRDLLLVLLDEQALQGRPLRSEAKALVAAWSGRAASADVGYAIVGAFRGEIRAAVFDALTATARDKFPLTRFQPSSQFEGPLWQLVTQRPDHLLNPRYKNWHDALLAGFDRVVAQMNERCDGLAHCTWGRQNVLRMRHPLSSALPWASSWLDMPADELSGDANMPRVQGPSFGASQRLVVSPGREAEGYFQMPGGQSGHPLSPYYGAGHEAWVRGEPTALLPGETEYLLRLVPRRRL